MREKQILEKLQKLCRESSVGVELWFDRDGYPESEDWETFLLWVENVIRMAD